MSLGLVVGGEGIGWGLLGAGRFVPVSWRILSYTLCLIARETFMTSEIQELQSVHGQIKINDAN